MIDFSSLDWQKNGDSLLPVIVQDVRTSQVLMLGYMDEQALRETISTRNVTFYSRSKRRLWKKGETSGNTLRVVSIASDCDGDVILIKVIPAGPTCHIGRRSCFKNQEENALETIGLLMETIEERSRSGSSESYTKKLLDGGKGLYGSKMREEALELFEAVQGEGRERVVEEASDLLYHFLVLLRGEGVTMGDVARELRRRREKDK